jgi:hypothetical protein
VRTRPKISDWAAGGHTRDTCKDELPPGASDTVIIRPRTYPYQSRGIGIEITPKDLAIRAVKLEDHEWTQLSNHEVREPKSRMRNKQAKPCRAIKAADDWDRNRQVEAIDNDPESGGGAFVGPITLNEGCEGAPTSTPEHRPCYSR